jgi:hypothetical protein
MLKFLVVTFLAIHCNCQQLIEIGGNNARSARFASSFPILGGGVSSLRSIGGFSSFGAQPFGIQQFGAQPFGVQRYGVQQYLSPASYGLGLSTIGGLRQSVLNYGLGGLTVAGVQPAYQQVAVQPAYQSVAVQPAFQTVVQPAVQTVVARPQIQTVEVAQPAVYAQTLDARQQVVPVSAAIQQVGRTVEYRSVPFNDQPIEPQVVQVEPSDLPVHIHFKSRSSTVQLSQEHIPGQPGTVEQTSSQDEPSKVIHEVVKPVIQEVREVIQPYRQLSQEIQPVVENIHTVVSKGEGERRQFIAQQYATQYAQPLQVAQVAQPVQVAQVAQPLQYQTVSRVAQPVQYQTVAQVAQPVQYQTVAQVAQPIQYQTVARVAQPVQYQTVAQVAQPLQYQTVQAVRTVAQPAYGVQSYRSVVQPAQSLVAVEQPSVSVIGVDSRQGSNGAYLSSRVQPVGSVSYSSRTYSESDRK